MPELTLVRENLMTREGYTPYCGDRMCPKSPRTVWDSKLNQFKCPSCGWVSKFPNDFIVRYKIRWEIK